MSIALSFQNDLALLQLDDGRANALNPASMVALNNALDQAQSASALVIAGRPGVFSGGLDLKLLPNLSHDDLYACIDQFTALMMRLYRWPRPVVAAVSGHALGGGAILALTADIRYFAEVELRFGLIEVPVGVPLPGFAFAMARSAVSGSTLTEMVMHGREYSASDAHLSGIAQDTFPADALITQACEKAAKLAKLPGDAYASTKARLRAPEIALAEKALQEEGNGFIEAFEAMIQRRKRA